MAGRILIDDGGRAFDTNGVIISGAKLKAFLAGTSTPASLYTTIALNVAHASPVVANASGYFAQMWAADDALLDINLYAAADVTYTTPLRPFLNVTPQGGGGSAEADFGGQYLQTLSAIRQGVAPSFLRWVASAQHAAILDGTSTYDAGARLNVAIGDLTAETGSGGTLRLPYGLINIEEEITVDENVALIGEGQNATVLRSTAAAGRLRFPSPTVDNRGGICGSFTIDGDDIGEDLLKLEMAEQRMFLHVKVMQSLTNGCVLNGAQNCDFFGFSSEHNKLANLILDYGAGNNRFVGFELNRAGQWGLKFLQSGAPTSDGQFQAGPRANRLQHGAIERAGYVNQGDLGDPDTASGLIYHGAGQGNEISNVCFSLLDLSSTLKPIIKMVEDNASYPSTGLTLNDILWSGTEARTTALEVGAACEAILGGRHTFEGAAAAFAIADTGNVRGVFEASYGGVTAVFANLGGGSSTVEDLLTRTLRGRTVMTGSASTAVMHRLNVAGEPNGRYDLRADGLVFIGPGSATFDVSYGRLGVGLFGTADKLVATGGLCVGNSAAGSTLGTVTKKMEVFSAAGASLGFVPVYDAIT